MTPALLVSPTPDHAMPFTAHQPPPDLTPSSGQLLVSTLSASKSTFLQPPASLHAAALALAKRYLDPLAASASESQSAQLQALRKKRKRGETDDQESRNILRLRQVHLEGFAIDQVWEQARRVLDASRQETERSLQAALGAEKPSASAPSTTTNGTKSVKTVRFDDGGVGSSNDGEEVKFENDQMVEEMDEPDSRMEHDDSDGGELEEEEEEEDIEDDFELEDGEGIEESSDLNEEDGRPAGDAESFVEDKHGLNDGFFSIDDFNRATEFLERQDAKGDPDDGIASDEEDIDWETDPTSLPSAAKGKSRPGGDDLESSDEGDGPTFGSADLNAPFDSDEDEGDDENMPMEDTTLSNTNDIKYDDFFAPPPQSTKNIRRRPLPKTQPPRANPAQPTDADIQRTIASVRRDIFDDDDISNPSDASDAENQHLSTHERRQASLAAQIRALEAEAVAKREWTLSGEARAADRPLNSLLEEDLEFERAGKPVPVITAEVSASIEELIKARILARNFDEVPKRRPGADALSAPGTKRGLVEVDDRKNEQSLAEIYETEHMRNTDPNFVDERDAKLKAAHEEIEKLWADVSAKLDALSSWNYRPKPPGVEVTVVNDAPRIMMEDARPSGVGIGTEQSGLAPQEVYKVGEKKEKGEVVTKAGGVVGEAELTREQKLRRRRREKERIRKRGEGDKDGRTEGKKAKEKKEVVGNLKKAGVKVIGKSGEVRDVEGNKIKAITGRKGANNFKL